MTDHMHEPADIRATAQVVMSQFYNGGGALHDLIAVALFAERRAGMIARTVSARNEPNSGDCNVNENGAKGA